MSSKRSTRERFTFTTPGHLMDAASKICVEPDREYPFLAEFHRENSGEYRLFSLETISRSSSYHSLGCIGRTGWDVEWIERDQQYAYHQSSGGGSLRRTISGIYWPHPEMLHVVREETARYCDRKFRKRNKTRRIRRIPIDLDGCEDMMQWLESNAIESSVYYCTVCKEHLPDREEDLCQHVWWCNTDSALRGPGESEGYGSEPCEDEDCFYCNRHRPEKT